MKKILLTFGLLIYTFSLVAQQSFTQHAALGERASALLQECVTFQETAGISAAISLEGKVVWQDGAGYRDVEGRIKAEATMLHRIASISKPMTAVAIMQLYEQGKLSLDDPIQQYVPYFPKKKDGMITIRHLLNHSSGIKAYQSRKEAFSTKNYPTLKEAIAVFQNRNLAHAPGKGYSYTTYGYVVLGAVIETVSGLSYRDYMKKHIWNPAGMEHTDVEIYGNTYQQKSKLYIKEANGSIVPDQLTDLSVKVPGGGIQSTATDLLKFGHAILNNQLIRQETLQMMIIDSGHKKNGNPYGFGWFLYADASKPTGRIFGHSGSQSGTSTQFMIYPDQQMVIATLSNTAGTWSKILGLNNKLGSLVTDPAQLKMPLRTAIMIDPSQLDQYTGSYQSDAGETVRIVRKGKYLYLDPEDHNQQKMFASSAASFFFRSNSLPDASVDFTFSSSDKITEMSLQTAEATKRYIKSDVKSLAWGLYNAFDEQGEKSAIKWYKQHLEKKRWQISSDEMKTAAYNLLNTGRIIEGLKMLELNVKSFPSNSDALDEEVMNNVGYQLLNAGAHDLAIGFFELNATVFPSSANAFDSLAEAYMKANKTKLAIKNYEKSLELNPENPKGQAALRQLKGGD